MILNPDKFKPLSLRKTKSLIFQLVQFRIGNNKADFESSAKLLGINIDTQLSFNQHIVIFINLLPIN